MSGKVFKKLQLTDPQGVTKKKLRLIIEQAQVRVEEDKKKPATLYTWSFEEVRNVDLVQNGKSAPQLWVENEMGSYCFAGSNCKEAEAELQTQWRAYFDALDEYGHQDDFGAHPDDLGAHMDEFGAAEPDGLGPSGESEYGLGPPPDGSGSPLGDGGLGEDRSDLGPTQDECQQLAGEISPPLDISPVVDLAGYGMMRLCSVSVEWPICRYDWHQAQAIARSVPNR